MKYLRRYIILELFDFFVIFGDLFARLKFASGDEYTLLGFLAFEWGLLAVWPELAWLAAIVDG
jgi:hypothetical protein